MSNLDPIYRRPEGLDCSVTGLEARMTALQPSLKALMDKALTLFDDVYPQAPHPRDAHNSPVYATSTLNICPNENIPMGRELTVVLGQGTWVRVFRNTDSCDNAYSRQRLWFQRPEGELQRLVNVMRTHNPARVNFPYNIETGDFRQDQCVGFVNGAMCYQEEPFIAEANAALGTARLVALFNGFMVPAAE